MKLLTISAIVVLSSFLTTSHAQKVIPFDEKQWVFEGQAHLLEGFQGYNSLYLQGGKAILKDSKFLNGVIEFDIWLFKRTSFSGLVFRRTDARNYEELYMRSQQSGMADAFQYTPVFNADAGWQLYHDQHDGLNDGFVSWKPRGELNGYNTTATFPFDRWLHVKMMIKGTQAELYLDNKEEPIAFIKELKMGEHAGGICVESNVGAVYFANFSYTSTDNPPMKNNASAIKWTALPGTITSWQVSNAFKENDIVNKNQLDAKSLEFFLWQKLPIEKGDFVNLSRLSTTTDSANTVFAKLVLNSDKDQIKRIDVGYSDRLKAWCNGKAMYSGNNGFRSQDFRHLGTMGYFDALYLPLKKGDNTIVFAVSETFGGWGLMGKLENMEGVQMKE